MDAKAVLFTHPHRVSVRLVRVPDPDLGQLIVEAECTCISPGTELRCLAGKEPGASGWPIIPGYVLVGQVLRRGPGTSLEEGTIVLCAGTEAADVGRTWGGHISHAVASEQNLIPLPDDVQPLDACIARLAAIPYHGLRLSRPAPHERVIVIGLGLIGQAASRLYEASGAQVLGVDLLEHRVQIARDAGLDARVRQGTLRATCADVFPEGVDIIVDATGSPNALPEALALARDVPWDQSEWRGTRYVIQGSYPGEVAIPYRDAFLKEMSFLLPRDWQHRDLYAVLDLVRRRKANLGGLISEVRPPEDAPRTYQELADPKGRLLTVAFRWA